MTPRVASGACGIALVTCIALVCGCGRTADVQPGGKIIIASSPESGAEVSIRGVSRGHTPVTIERLVAGKALVVLVKDGYKRATRMVRVPERGEHRIVVELEPLVGYVTFECKPQGAEVFLDGVEFLGTTPVVHRPIVVGKHTYELRKENYKPTSSTITVEKDYRYTFAHELTPKEARLSIFSRPSNARVWLNDEERLETTPTKLELTPGTYTVRIHSKGYVEAEETVLLGPNEERSIEVVLRQGDVPAGMVLVPAGKFIMGTDGASPDERPQREVYVDAFYIDKFEVTNQEFKAVFALRKFSKDEERFPVVGISFNQATEYAQKVGKRLPTEAEWEKAARGTDGREYPWGMEFDASRCNFSETGVNDVVRVGTYRPGVSPYGCMDMAGNAYEWASDWYQAYPGNTDVTKDYGQIFRVLRGGSFASDRFMVRCARRHYDRMGSAGHDYGFRCVKDIEGGSGAP